MKRLIKAVFIILALSGCLGFFGSLISEINSVASDTNYSIEQKKTAFEIVADQLEEQLQKILSGEDIYADKHSCNPE